MTKVCNICVCEPTRILGCISNETRASLTIILKVNEDYIFNVKNFTLIKNMFKSY